MNNYIEQLERISPLLESPDFYDTVRRAEFYWESLQDYNLYENLSILDQCDTVDVIVPSYTNDAFTQLTLARAGDCACVSYCSTYGGIKLSIFVDIDNKIKALVAVNTDRDNKPVVDVFFGSNFIRLFHLVIPRTELEEILFQFGTVRDINLSFLEKYA